jgi:hypothetical protein
VGRVRVGVGNLRLAWFAAFRLYRPNPRHLSGIFEAVSGTAAKASTGRGRQQAEASSGRRLARWCQTTAGNGTHHQHIRFLRLPKNWNSPLCPICNCPKWRLAASPWEITKRRGCCIGARDDASPRSRDAEIAPGFCRNDTPRSVRSERAQGMPGAQPHPQPCVRRRKAHKHSHHRLAETFRHSLRGGFNGFLRDLPGDRAFLPPSLARSSIRKLDISVGISGPHDFTVRFRAARLAHPKRPSHPALHVRDDA